MNMASQNRRTEMTNEEFTEEVRSDIFRSIRVVRLNNYKDAAYAAWKAWRDLTAAQKVSLEAAWNRAVLAQDLADEEQRVFDQS